LPGKVGVEGGGLGERDGEDGAESVNHIAPKKERNFETRVKRQFLKMIADFRIA